MINDDTIKLLRECNSGVKMGVISLDDVLGHVRDENLEKRLSACKQAHESLGDETHDLLNEYNDTGKEPNPVAKGISWVKTNVQLAMNDSDKTIAALITDGCNMGVKSLIRYLNQYKAASETAKDIAKRLIHLEERLAVDLRAYL